MCHIRTTTAATATNFSNSFYDVTSVCAFSDCVFSCHGEDGDFATVHYSSQYYNAANFITHLVTQVTESVNAVSFYFLYESRNAFQIANLVSNVANLCFSDLCSQFVSFLLDSFKFSLQCFQTSRNVVYTAFQFCSQTFNHGFGCIYMFNCTVTGYSFDTANASTGGCFGNDFEHADLSSIRYMATTAEFHGEFRNGYYANNVAIFFTEECGCTTFFSFFDGKFFNSNFFSCQDFFVNDCFYFFQFSFSYLGEVREVKTQTVGTNIGTSLVYMTTENLFQSSMEQVGCSVVTSDVVFTSILYSEGYFFTNIYNAFYNITNHDGSAVRQFFGYGYFDYAGRSSNGTDVTQLTAAFSVESSYVADNSNFSAVTSSFNGLCILCRIQAYDFTSGCSFVNFKVSYYYTVGVIDNRTACFVVACVTSHFTLNFESSVKASFVHGHAMFFENFSSQFPGEAKGVVQFESSCAIKNSAVGFFQFSDFFIQKFATLFQGTEEAGFFHFDNFLDVFAFFSQVGVNVTEHFDYDINCTSKEHLVDTNQATMTNCTAQDAAQYIATTFVGGQNAVANHKGHAACVVSDNFKGYFRFFVSTVFDTSDFCSVFDNREHQVGFKVGRFVLEYGSKTFQTSTGIDVFVFERSVSAVFVLVVLGKYQVPKFEETVTVAAYCAIRFAAAAFFTKVNVDFGARTAGAGTDFPEVFFHADDAGRVNANIFSPDFESFVVFSVDGDPEFIYGQFANFSEEFPAPGDNFFFEVITKGEVTKHFKEGMVASSTANVFNVTGTYAFLASGDTRRRRFHFASEERFEGCHTCTDNQQGRVVLRNQGRTGQHQMLFFFEKFKELFANFITSHVFHN